MIHLYLKNFNDLLHDILLHPCVKAIVNVNAAADVDQIDFMNPITTSLLIDQLFIGNQIDNNLFMISLILLFNSCSELKRYYLV